MTSSWGMWSCRHPASPVGVRGNARRVGRAVVARKPERLRATAVAASVFTVCSRRSSVLMLGRWSRAGGGWVLLDRPHRAVDSAPIRRSRTSSRSLPQRRTEALTRDLDDPSTIRLIASSFWTATDPLVRGCWRSGRWSAWTGDDVRLRSRVEHGDSERDQAVERWRDWVADRGTTRQRVAMTEQPMTDPHGRTPAHANGT